MLFLDKSLLYIREIIALMGVLIICFGALHALYELLLGRRDQENTRNYVRLHLGESIILGLEFMVGADIVGSLVEPDYYNLGLLALLVVIRTVLSYFLNAELAGLTFKQQKGLR